MGVSRGISRLSSARRIWLYVLDHSILLLIGAITAFLWANLDLDSYERLAHRIHFIVNDVGMAFFFAMAVKEVAEAIAPGGVLHSPRRSAMPLLAAVGGMAGPAVIFMALAVVTGNRELLPGWAIPCATDIAFSYLVARLVFGGRHSAIPFLLLLAVADDVLGLGILATFYPVGRVRLVEFAILLGIAVGIAMLLRRRVRRNFWPYIVGAGVVSWFGFYVGGLHPALALVPIIPLMPHAARDPGLFVENASGSRDALTHFEHWWKTPVQAVLFFFGLANAGVPLSTTGVGTWIVLGSILIGKPVGILLFCYLGVVLGLHLPSNLSRRDLFVLGCAAGIGFTVALFFATAAFPEGPLLDETKMGALFSFGAALLTVAAAFLLRVGRFAKKEG